MSGVQRVERGIELALQPQARHREEQPGDRHGEQPGEREEVAGPLGRQGARVAQAAAEEHEHAGQHEHGRDVERVVEEPATMLSASNCIVPMRERYTW